MNYWAKERYSNKDYLASELDLSKIEPSKNWKVEYNQDEFMEKDKHSSYCTAYWCFANYSRYTGLEISKEWRKEFVDICLEKKLIIDWIGWYVLDVVEEFAKFISIKTEIDFSFARADCSDREASDMFWLVWGFRGNTEFKKDRQDNCIIENIDYGAGKWGHCIMEYSSKYTQDSYYPRKCNIYEIKDFDWFTTGSNHFVNWYFFYRIKINEQLNQDIADIEEALRLEITNNKKNIEKIKAGLYDTDVKMLLFIMRSRKLPL